MMRSGKRSVEPGPFIQEYDLRRVLMATLDPSTSGTSPQISGRRSSKIEGWKRWALGFNARRNKTPDRRISQKAWLLGFVLR